MPLLPLRTRPFAVYATMRCTHAVLRADNLDINHLLHGSAGRTLLLDLSAVSIMTAGGLGKLVALHKLVRDSGSRLVLCNVSERAYEVFSVMRLTEVLSVRHDLPDGRPCEA